MELKIEYLPVGELKAYDRNTRKHQDKDVTEIAKSIEKYGFSDPIGVWGEKNIIVEGHGRLLAARKLGIETVPVIHLDHLTDEERREYAIMHNRTAELSGWDFEMLAKEMEDLDLSEFDLDIAGFDMEDNDFDTQELEEVEAPEPPAEPTAKPGQIYQLGRHRLMCGDSTNPKDVERLMDGEMADALITDPPYNVNYEGGTDEKLKIENDNMDAESFQAFLFAAFENAKDNLKPGGAFYVWYASREVVNFVTALKRAGLEVRQELIWNKNALVLGRQDYQWKHEPCLYGWKDGAGHFFINSRIETTVIPDLHEIEPKKMKKEELAELLERILQQIPTTVIDENKPNANRMHPTMKPIGLIGYQMRNSTKKDEKVLDLFGGSGTTLMAAEQIKRRCYMMEFDPRYVDVIIQRWEEFTGRKAELIN